MNNASSKWVLLILLALVWGSSFILIKKSLLALTPLQVGALRVLIAGFSLFLLGFKHFKTYSRRDYAWLMASGFCGGLLPALLFAFAQTRVPSGVTGILDTLIPLFTLLTGLAFFGEKPQGNQLMGILIGLLGAWYLVNPGHSLEQPLSLTHVGLVILGTLSYGLNANIVKSRLSHLKARAVAIGSLSFSALPALGILACTSFKNLTYNPAIAQSLLAIFLLALLGTALALLGFYKLIQLSSPVFATSVAYLMPIVSVFWALLDGESFSLSQSFATFLILSGVYLINKKKTPRSALNSQAVR